MSKLNLKEVVLTATVERDGKTEVAAKFQYSECSDVRPDWQMVSIKTEHNDCETAYLFDGVTISDEMLTLLQTYAVIVEATVHHARADRYGHPGNCLSGFEAVSICEFNNFAFSDSLEVFYHDTGDDTLETYEFNLSLHPDAQSRWGELLVLQGLQASSMA